tara:strand:- start:178 stop:333 length:156 start_codon:yes stop_codon:yes gene_type:complete
MADYYKGSPGQDVRDYSGKKKKKETYEQLSIPNLHGKKKAARFKTTNSVNA